MASPAIDIQVGLWSDIHQARDNKDYELFLDLAKELQKLLPARDYVTEFMSRIVQDEALKGDAYSADYAMGVLQDYDAPDEIIFQMEQVLKSKGVSSIDCLIDCYNLMEPVVERVPRIVRQPYARRVVDPEEL